MGYSHEKQQEVHYQKRLIPFHCSIKSPPTCYVMWRFPAGFGKESWNKKPVLFALLSLLSF